MVIPNKAEPARIALLILIMAAVGLIMSGVSIAILYNTSFEMTRQRLVETAVSRARLLEVFVQGNIDHLRQHDDFTLQKAMDQSLAEIRQAHHNFEGFGQTGEFTMAKREGDNIVFVLRHRHADQDKLLPIPFDSFLAEPMRRALLGQSGTLIGLDYRNVTTLAAHEPVAVLNMGIVAKIDLSEVRAPFIRAGLIVLGIGLLVISLGTFLFYKVGNPMVQQLMETAALRTSRLKLAEAKEALEEKAVYLDNILRTSTDLAIVATDLALSIKYFNPAAERMLGYQADQVLGRNVHSIQPEQNVAMEKFIIDLEVARIQGEHTYIVEQSADQGGRILEATVSPITDRDGEMAGFMLLARDVTQARCDQEALIRSESKYRLLLESANDAILIADAATGVILDANLMAGELLGRPPDEIIGMHQSELHPPAEVERYSKMFQEHVRERRGLLSGIVVVKKDGTLVPVEIRSGVTDLGDKKVIQGIFRDVTERIQLEQKLIEANQELEQRVRVRTRELERSNQDLQQFAYVASHDLQEPLRLITGYVQLLEQRYRGNLDEKADKFINYTVDSVKHMQELINNLLTYARVGSAGGDFIDVEMDQLLIRVLESLRMPIEDAQAVITVDPLPTVRVDSIQMTQLFQNLIGNAVKFRGDEPPRIHIKAARGAGEWIFSVHDNGIGIEDKHRERIFLIFQKLHSRARYEGTGIGLSLCKRIVERHGGRIWVGSEAGSGSSFHFAIPDGGPS